MKAQPLLREAAATRGVNIDATKHCYSATEKHRLGNTESYLENSPRRARVRFINIMSEWSKRLVWSMSRSSAASAIKIADIISVLVDVKLRDHRECFQ